MGLHKKAGKTVGVDFFLSNVSTLRLYKAGIATIDTSFRDLVNVKELTLSGNQIEVLENLPPNVEVVQAQCNHIHTVGDLTMHPALYHLGLSFNHLESLSSLSQALPELRSLDLGYNRLARRDEIIDQLKPLGVKNLVLAGNPCAMTPFYREDVLVGLAGSKGKEILRWLDDITISAVERDSLLSCERIGEQRMAPLKLKLKCEFIENGDKLNEELPEDATLIPYGPWHTDYIDPNPVEWKCPAEPEEGWGKGGEPTHPEPIAAPPAPVVVHEYYVEVDCFGEKMLSRLYKSDEIEASFQPLPPEEPQPELAEGEEPPPPPGEDEEVPPPPPLVIELGDWVPSVQARDLARGKGIEVHLVRKTSFHHGEHAEAYAAMAPPWHMLEDSEQFGGSGAASEEKLAAYRALPEDTSVEALLRVGLGEMSGILEGLCEFPIEAKLLNGKVVDTARLDNWAIIAENEKQINHGLLQSAQSLKMSFKVEHDWSPPEPEAPAEEEPAE